MNTHHSTILEVTQDSFKQLHEIWLASVRATHTFLTDADIEQISPLVLQGLAQGRTFCSTDKREQICAFINIVQTKIEMLFVHPDHFTRGHGRALLQYAEKQYAVSDVDVNEQNPQAVQFYLHMGFHCVARSALDSSGAPFPLLHLTKKVPTTT